MKNAKKTPSSLKLTFNKGQYLKLANINLVLVSKHVRKKLWNLLTQIIQFTDKQMWIKKPQNVEKNLFIYASTKYLPI